MEQKSPEWFAARCGKVTASRVADIIAKTKSGPSASRENYLAQLVCERMTGMKRKLTGSAKAADPDSRINKSLKKWGC